MTRCGGCDNDLWCPCCAGGYSSTKEVLEETVRRCKMEMEDAAKILYSTNWDKNGEPVE